MKTNETKTNKTIAMFHISGGGGNQKKLSFVGFKPISKCADFETELFLRDEKGKCVDDVAGRNPNKLHWTDSSGHDVGLTYEEYLSGIGTINIDGDYNTTYTLYAADLNEDELYAMVNPGQGFYYLDSELDKALVEFGFGEDEVLLAREADDIKSLVEYGVGQTVNGEYKSAYIDEEFEAVDNVNGDDYKIKGRAYKKL